jgi:hypothetical protein
MTKIVFERRTLTAAEPQHVFDWCDKHFGDTWKWDHNWPGVYCFFRFKDDKDAMLFLLKWKNN